MRCTHWRRSTTRGIDNYRIGIKIYKVRTTWSTFAIDLCTRRDVGEVLAVCYVTHEDTHKARRSETRSMMLAGKRG